MTDARFRAFLVEQAPRRAPDELLGRAMTALDGVEQPRPWLVRWPVLRFAAPLAAAVSVVVLVVSALLLLDSPPPVVGPSPSAGETAGETAGPTGSPTATPSPSPEPTPPPTPLPSVEGLLSGPATCTNEGAGYSVAVPAGWYANVDQGTLFGPCSAFFVQPAEGQALMDAGGITSLVMSGDPVSREFAATEHRDLTLDGMPAIREVGTGIAGPVVRYAVSLDGSPIALDGSGPVLSVMAFGGSVVGMDAATEALDDIMAGFRLLQRDAVVGAVLARIELPLSWDGAAAGDRVAVTPGAVWIAGEAPGGGRLVRVDPATNRIAATFAMNVVALATDHAGALWVLGDPDPGDGAMLLSRFDASGTQPQTVGEVEEADDLAIGLDSAWLIHSSVGIRQLDLSSAAEVRLITTRGRSIDVACDAVWTWWPDPAIEGGEYLAQMDLPTGQPVVTYKLRPPVDRELVEIGEYCWTAAAGSVQGVMAGQPEGAIGPRVWVDGRVQFAGKSAWGVTDEGVGRRIALRTGFGRGDTFQLSFDDVPRGADGSPEYRLLSASGDLWVVAGNELVRYDIPAD